MTYGNKGEALRDHELALARGPVMLGTPAKPNDPKVGRVLGGGRVKKEYPYTLVIKENRESYYTAKMLESVVNAAVPPDRGRAPEGGGDRQDRQLPGAPASPSCTTRTRPRYFRVVQSLPMIDGPELRARRQAAWSKELLDPKTAGVAALKLEGLGPTRGRRAQGGPEEPQ